MVELYCQGEVEVLGEKPVAVPLRPTTVPHFLAWDWWMEGRKLTALVFSRPENYVTDALKTATQCCYGYFFSLITAA